jgi:hypothetical protein
MRWTTACTVSVLSTQLMACGPANDFAAGGGAKSPPSQSVSARAGGSAQRGAPAPVATPAAQADPDVRELILRLQSTSADRQELAADDLARLGPRAAPALPHLLPLLDDESAIVCVAAYRAICAIGPAATSAIPEIVKGARRRLARQDYCGGAYTLCTYWPEAIPSLVAELGRDPNTDEVPENMLSGVENTTLRVLLPAMEAILLEGRPRAESAAGVLWRMRSSSRPAVPSLVKALRAGRITDSTFAWAMLQIGGDEAGALAELQRIAKQRDDLTGQQAREALAKVRR